MMKCLIAGAGIGGLTTALTLLKLGHDVRVYEQSPRLEETGAGIQLGANALCVLADLDLLDALSEHSVTPERVDFHSLRTGKRLHTQPLGSAYHARYQRPYYHLRRADLQRTLADALTRLAPNALTLNAQVVQHTEHPSHVSITLSSGECIDGDCLIAADGIKSRIKQQLFPEHSPIDSGYLAWRGMLPADALPDDFMPLIARNFVGKYAHMVMYYVNAGHTLNFVGVVKATASDKRTDAHHSPHNNDWVSQAPWEAFKHDFQHAHSTVQTLIDRVDRNACHRWQLYDQPALPYWSTSRVTLLGDAAHACLPFMASGAAMAIEDASVLSRSIHQASSSLSDALTTYETARRPRTQRIQRLSRHAGHLYHLPNEWVQRAGFHALKLRAHSLNDWLASYDATAIDLR